ncbi:MAG: hypothetical protein H6613_20855 [Ignavibacteriales bacterium]|nr:hypothetical protein [Ignavibacteriales bacterium]
MVKKIIKQTVDSNKYIDFKNVATNFIEGAKVAYEFEYFQAAGLLAIHSAIAFADAITVKLKSEKCSGENHYEVLNLLRDSVPQNKNHTQAIKQFKNLIDHKNLISYTGDVYNKKDVDKIMKYYERFSSWAITTLDQ